MGLPFPRAIVHLDADAFFASVEQAADSRLRGKPIAVGGEKRGIIASASYEARRFGIYTPMPTVLARRLCPKLILLPGDFEKYELFSRLMFSYAYDFTPDVEIGSIDEGYFDLTGARRPALGIAQTIRQAIRQALKLSVSEGIAANKLVSQIASKLKKPSAFEFVPPGHEAEFLHPLANKWLPGIGPKTAIQLNAAGLARIGQVARTPVELLNLLVGRLAPQLRRFAWGLDDRPIIPVRAPAKSYGEQETFAADTTDEEFLAATLRRMADKLMAKVREDGKSIRTVTVKVRYNDMDEQQAAESLSEPTDLETEIYSQTTLLLRKAWQRRVSLRLVSLKLGNVYAGAFRSGLALEVADRRHGAQERLAVAVDDLRQKFGRAVLLRGHDFVLQRADRLEHPTSSHGRRSTVSVPTATPPQQVPINTPLQRGGSAANKNLNRFSGFQRAGALAQTTKTAKAVQDSNSRPVTSLKRGVNENPGSYRLAILERQRIGNSFARAQPPPEKTYSPAPELRFRTTTEHQGSHVTPSRHRPKAGHSSRPTLIPLNVHSYYSFLDSTLSIKAVVELAKRHEFPAVALTDKNNLHGAVEFAQAAAEAGIKPIIGTELNYGGHRLCLYVQNQTGYRNLCRILNRLAAVQTLSMKRSPESPSPLPLSPRRGEQAGSGPWGSWSHFMRIRERGFPINQTPKVNDKCQMLNAQCSMNPGQREVVGNKPYPAPRAFDNFCARDEYSPISNSQFSIFNSVIETEGLLALGPSPALAHFFPDRFYLEINSSEVCDKFLQHSSTPALHHPIPLVASFPVHYALPSDRWKYDIVQSIRTLTLLRQAHPEKRLDGAYHFRSPTELQRLFATHPELLAHSHDIADRCDFTFELGKPQFPHYSPPDGSTPAAFLRRLVMAGLRRRYPKEHLRLKHQLEEELAIILNVGYEEYFLVMWDILQECRRRGIDWITRGSAADSLACYCLEISNVCPIRFDLYFRRFLNKERMALNKLPDIDVDFPHDRKDDVVDLIFETYGPEHAAIVGGFSTFQSRSAFAEVAKVLGVSEFQVRRLTERLPHFSRAGELAEVAADSLECRDLPLNQEPYSTALQMAGFLDGFPRYPKMHPCGLVLSRQPMNQITPCFRSAKGYPTTHFDMDSVEAVGLVKMDILAQGGLAVMRDVLEMVARENHPCPALINTPLQRGGSAADKNLNRFSGFQDFGPPAQSRKTAKAVQNSNSPSLTPLKRGVNENETAKCSGQLPITNSQFSILNSPVDSPSTFSLPSPASPFDDPQVWSLIASGNARAVHHIESPAMISLCKMCNARDIDTLIAIVSVIRPGAANESKKMEFARRYQGLSPVRYPHPSLEACLRSTYGLVVYEEHILQICEAFAGLPPGRADLLRRALGKNKTALIDQIQTEFAACARNRGRAEAEIAEVWDLVVGFRGYAFCKAHSTAYGVEAYQSAWLKLHYPAPFMAAVLTNGKGFYSPLVYVLEARRLGIPLLPPSVNHPGPHFAVQPPSGPSQPQVSRPHESKLEIAGSMTNNKCSMLNAQWIPLHQPRHESPPGPAAGPSAICNAQFSILNSDGFFAIRVPALQVKGLTLRTKEAMVREFERGPFTSLTDFFLRVQPLPEEMEALIRVGAFDEFGQTRTAQYWQFKSLCQANCQSGTLPPQQLWLLPPALERLPAAPLSEPTRLDRLRAEDELLGYPVSGHPLELYPDIAWETYCPVNRLGRHIGQQIVTCGLVIEQRLFHQVTGEPMKFITIADWTGIIETELFAKTYRSYGLNTVRYRVLEITATVEPFENGRGYTLRVHRAGKPRSKG